MEIAGTTLSAVQTILAALQCQELKEIHSMTDYKSQLDDLQSTVETIDSVLRDAAEIKQKLLPHQERRLIDELKDAVFEADDLLGEFVTIAQQKQLLKADGKVS
uniref:Disease resistance N-terminal domain-containing protein n=1 Tax=Chenopodium quinoa TaxID=63459 RepID=A0A803MWR2_CHEQI